MTESTAHKAWTITVTWKGDTAAKAVILTHTTTIHPDGRVTTRKTPARTVTLETPKDHMTRAHMDELLTRWGWRRQTSWSSGKWSDGRPFAAAVERVNEDEPMTHHEDPEPATAAPVDQADAKLHELDELSARIRKLEAELEAERAQRVRTVRDVLALDGVTAAEVAGRLGISRRRVYKMIEETQEG